MNKVEKKALDYINNVTCTGGDHASMDECGLKKLLAIVEPLFHPSTENPMSRRSNLALRRKDAEIDRLRAELAERDGQEPLAYIAPGALEAGEANVILAEDVPDANKSRMIPLYRHPPAPAAVPEDFFDKLRAAFERLFWLERQGKGMPTEEVIDQGLNDAIEDQQENIRTMLRPAEPASRSESEAKKVFPMQNGPDVPWSLGQILYAGYAAFWGNPSNLQSMERVAQRHGLAWGEVEAFWCNRDAREAMNKEAARLRGEGEES